MFWAGVDAISTCAGEDPQKNGLWVPKLQLPGCRRWTRRCLWWACLALQLPSCCFRRGSWSTKYFASVWIRLLVVDSTPLRGFQTLAAPTARKATEEAVVWQLDRETFSHIVRDASAKRREAFQDFLNLGKAWRGVSRSSYVVGSWNNGGVRDCENVFVNVCDLHPALVGSYSIYGMWPLRKTVPLFKPLESYDLMYSTQCQCNFGAWSHGVSTVVTYQGSWLIACSRRAWMLDRTLAERGLGQPHQVWHESSSHHQVKSVKSNSDVVVGLQHENLARRIILCDSYAVRGQ